MFKVNKYVTKSYALAPNFVKNIFGSVYSYWSDKYKYGKTYEKWRNFLKESQYYNKEQIENYQKENLRSLLKFAENNCEYYKNIIKENNIDIENGNIFEELKKFPILTKDIIRKNYNNIKTGLGKNDKLIFSTSGTTGTSLHVPVTQEALEREYAFKWQYQSIADAKFRDKFVYFTGHPVISVEKNTPPFWIKNYYENSINFSIYHLSKKNIQDYVKCFNEFSPSYITGYPSAIYTFVLLSKENGYKLNPVKAIYSASEVLHPFQKNLIEEYLQTKVYQWYGQVELTINLHECEYGNLHVKEEYGYLEILDDNNEEAKPGEYGNAIGTGFGNYAFPLIRYKTQDVFKLSKNQSCACHRAGRLIDHIYGRDEDIIITPSGNFVGRLDFVFKPVDTVKESQIIQEDLQNIIILVVTEEGYCKADEDLIIEKAKERLGNEMNIKVKEVDKISLEKSGKIRYVISKVKKNGQNDIVK